VYRSSGPTDLNDVTARDTSNHHCNRQIPYWQSINLEPMRQNGRVIQHLLVCPARGMDFAIVRATIICTTISGP
jgi:hypothetical protein